MNWYTIESIQPGVWHISEPIGAIEPRFGVDSANMFLVAGTERAAVIDTGMGIGDLRAAIEALTPLPLLVCNTRRFTSPRRSPPASMPTLASR